MTYREQILEILEADWLPAKVERDELGRWVVLLEQLEPQKDGGFIIHCRAFPFPNKRRAGNFLVDLLRF